MEGGMCVGKQIHLDEQACSAHLIYRATYSPWGLHAHLLEFRVAFSRRAVGGGRAGTPSSPYFYPVLKGLHAISRKVTEGKTNSWRSFNALALYAAFFRFGLGITEIFF
jgi:hypothetical protein